MNIEELETKIKELELANKSLRQKSTKTDYDELVTFIIENKHAYKSRRLLAQACEAEGLCKESSAFHYLSMQNYVDAYIRYTNKHQS